MQYAMTRQEIFDKVATHLLKQNAKAQDNDVCRYRTDDGLKCAVGCLIPDDKYTTIIESVGVYELLSKDNALSPPHKVARLAKVLYDIGAHKEDLQFLKELQLCHDGIDPDMWRTKLIYIATKFNLSTMVLKE